MFTEPSTAATRRWFAADLALGIFVFLLFFRCAAGEFAGLDDSQYVYNNSHVLNGLTWDGFCWAWKSTEVCNWHPLTWLSLQFDVTLFGSGPWGLHFTNVILHALSAVFLSIALRHLTGAAALSWLTSLLFAIHPLRVESVAWVSERKDVLSVLFGVLALLAYARYAKSPSIWRWSVLTGFFVLSLLAKPMLVTLPCTLLLLDFWPLARYGREPIRRLILEKVPLLATSGVCVAVTILVQVEGGAVASSERFPWSTRLANAVLSIATYLWQTVWPWNLAAFYPHPRRTLLEPRVWLTGVTLLALTVCLIRRRRSTPYLFVAWLWFVGGLLPVLGLVAQQGTQAHADRYTYWPHIGLLLGAVWGSERLAHKLHLPSAARCLMVLCVIVPWSVLSYRQMGTWKTVPELWSHAMKVTKDNAVAMNGLAAWYHNEGRDAESIALYLQALRADPKFGPPRFYLGRLYLDAGEFELAAKYLREASAEYPRDAAVWFNLGCAEARLGHRERAQECFEQAIQLKPDEGGAYYHLAVLLFDPADMSRPAKLLEEAVRLNPKSSQFQAGLGKVRYWEGKDAEAVIHFEKALEIDSSDVDTAEVLGQLLERLALYERAVAILQRTISKTASQRGNVLRALCGLALNAQGKSQEAARMYSLAKRENSDWSIGVARQGWSWASAENAGHRRPAWARQAARLLMEAYPSQPEGYDLLAAATAAEGRFDQAIKFAEKALSLTRQGSDLSARIRERRDRFKRNEVWIGPP